MWAGSNSGGINPSPGGLGSNCSRPGSGKGVCLCVTVMFRRRKNRVECDKKERKGVTEVGGQGVWKAHKREKEREKIVIIFH